MTWLDSPVVLLAFLVQQLEKMQSQMGQLIMDIYVETHHMTPEQAESNVLSFFQFFSVSTSTGGLEVHGSETDPAFINSSFQITLINSFGSLMELLMKLENVRSQAQDVRLAVDFEG